MKKKIFLMVCLAVLGILVVNAQVAALALHHKGKVTMYNGAKISDLLSAAEDGDTVYITTGILSTDITIAKKLTFIGAGPETVIRGTVSVAIPNTPTLTSRLLQDLKVDGKISVNQAVKGLHITKCQFNGISFAAETDASNIDKCVCWGNFVLSDKIVGLDIVTTKINTLEGDCTSADNAHFTNCNIKYFYNYYNSTLATYINCIILDYDHTTNFYSTLTIYTNCLFRYSVKAWTDCADYGCWYNDALSFDEDMNANGVTLTDYLGTDETVVGVTGTANPFTLNPSTPRVLTHKLGVNEAGNTLSVTLTVGN